MKVWLNSCLLAVPRWWTPQNVPWDTCYWNHLQRWLHPVYVSHLRQDSTAGASSRKTCPKVWSLHPLGRQDVRDLHLLKPTPNTPARFHEERCDLVCSSPSCASCAILHEFPTCHSKAQRSGTPSGALQGSPLAGSGALQLPVFPRLQLPVFPHLQMTKFSSSYSVQEVQKYNSCIALKAWALSTNSVSLINKPTIKITTAAVGAFNGSPFIIMDLQNLLHKAKRLTSKWTSELWWLLHDHHYTNLKFRPLSERSFRQQA